MQEIPKILIIRLSSIGDIVLASPLIRVVRAAYPKAQIDFLVKSEYAELARFNPNLSSIIELKTSEHAELQALRDRIRRDQYDVVLDIHNSLRSRYIRMFSGAHRTLVVDKRVFSRLLLVRFKWNLYKSVVSVADRYLETGQSLGIDVDQKGLEIFIPDGTMFSVASMMSKLKLERYNIVVGFAPTAKHATKQWPIERFVELGTNLAKEFQTKVLILGGKEDAEYCGDIAQMVNSQCNGSVAESFAGRFTLLETAAAIGFCDAVVCNDTGVMHLAAAMQRKIVAIFGSSVREFGFFPLGSETIVVENNNLRCRPCSHVGLDRCPKGHFRCMNDIHVTEVLGAFRQVLQSSYQRVS